MAKELTGLQQQLLSALVESGLSRHALLGACDALYGKQPESTESAVSAASETAEQEHKPKPCSDAQQITSSKSDAVKTEEAPKQIVTQETRLEEQQMNFVEHMLRYVYLNRSSDWYYYFPPIKLMSVMSFPVESCRKPLNYSIHCQVVADFSQLEKYTQSSSFLIRYLCFHFILNQVLKNTSTSRELLPKRASSFCDLTRRFFVLVVRT